MSAVMVESRRPGDTDLPRRAGDTDLPRRAGDTDLPRRAGDTDLHRRQRGKNLVTVGLLLLLAVGFFVLTIVRMGGKP